MFKKLLMVLILATSSIVLSGASFANCIENCQIKFDACRYNADKQFVKCKADCKKHGSPKGFSQCEHDCGVKGAHDVANECYEPNITCMNGCSTQK